jgi:type IV pilus assembly protein PilB
MEATTLLPLLEENGYITQDQSAEIQDELYRTGKPIEEILVNYQIFKNEKELAEKIAPLVGAEYIDLDTINFTPAILSSIPPQTARFHEAVPVSVEGNTITIALSDPLNIQARDDLGFVTNKTIQIAFAPPSEIRKKIEKYYGVDVGVPDNILADLAKEADKVQSLEDQANAAPIIKFVNTILAQAIQARASDIHFEPFETEFKIRYRVDGALYEMSPPPKSLAASVTSRIKVMSGLNIAERRIPQDGRIQTTMAGRQVDLRVSTLPTQFGESVVLRVLDRSVVNLELETLGMPKKIYDYVCDVIQKPNGIFIVTGPTGSGKTTTLYSCLRRINTIDSKLLTVEDPVEYDIEGIIQVQAQESIGLTFARVLRAFLRQDPDRIMVGETRDLETAQIAIQASLTGHLVFTTLHTNDATGAVTRLIDMGVEPFLIAASLEGVLAQRLIRRICTECRTPYEPDEFILSSLNLSPHEVAGKNFYYGKGCRSCNHTGYKGRKGIYELLDITDPIRDLITQSAPSLVIRQKAIELGMETLREDGLRAIFDGISTPEEVLKYT